MNRIPTIRMDGSVSDYEYFDSSSANDSTAHILEETSSLFFCTNNHHHKNGHHQSNDAETLRQVFRWMFMEYYRTPLLFILSALFIGGLLGFLLARWWWFFHSSLHKRTKCTSPPSTRNIPETTSNLPRHIAIVMDGNRRYGKLHNCNGHAAGARQIGNILEWTLEMPFVKELTLFCFSTQNWERDPEEVNYLFGVLLQDYIEQQLSHKVIQECIQVMVHSTDANRIPTNVREQLDSLVESTAHLGTKGHPEIRLRLNLCISYGGREEILAACRKLLEEQTDSSITEEEFTKQLCVQSNPDLLIRTAGDVRLSNFLLWQTSYTELCFMEEPWPAVSRERYRSVILDDFPNRQRRFGK